MGHSFPSALLFYSVKEEKMSGKKEATYHGTNNQGSSYTSYSDGGYTYKNPSGSSYYNTGSGHGFYNSGSKGTESSGGVPYKTSYNYNQGFSNTYYKIDTSMNLLHQLA